MATVVEHAEVAVRLQQIGGRSFRRSVYLAAVQAMGDTYVRSVHKPATKQSTSQAQEAKKCPSIHTSQSEPAGPACAHHCDRLCRCGSLAPSHLTALPVSTPICSLP